MKFVTAILIAIVEILAIPFVLLFVWGFVCICSWLCNEIFKCFLTGISSIKQKYQDFIKAEYKYDKEMEELDKQRVKVEPNPAKKISFGNKWDSVVKWTDEHYIITAFIASFIVAIIFLLLTLCVKEYVTDKERVVLAFVGVLATFIVLINHAQTSETSRRLEKQLDKNKEEMDALRSQSMEIQRSLSDNTGILVQKAFTKNLEFIDACQEKDTIPCARHIASMFTQNNKNTFSIRYESTEAQEESMTLVRREDRLYFKSHDDSKALSIASKEIRAIDSMEYNPEYIEPLVFNLILINEQKQRR